MLRSRPVGVNEKLRPGNFKSYQKFLWLTPVPESRSRHSMPFTLVSQKQLRGLIGVLAIALW